MKFWPGNPIGWAIAHYQALVFSCLSGVSKMAARFSFFANVPEEDLERRLVKSLHIIVEY